MTDDNVGKEGKSIKRVIERTKPTLMPFGDNKVVISSGKWNNECLAEYVLAHRDRWIPVGEIARVVYMANMPRSKAQVRRKLHMLFLYFLGRGYLLVIEYEGPHHRASAVKLYDNNASPLEQQSMAYKLEKMRVRAEMSTSNYHHAIAIVQQPPAAA